MMNHTRIFSIMLLASAFSAHADQMATPTIVVVELQKVFATAKLAKSIQGKVESEVNKRVAELKDIEKRFNELLEKLQKGGNDMNQSAQEKAQSELASLKAQLEVKQRNLQGYVEAETRKAEETLIKEVQKVCKKLGFDIVLPGVLYTKDQFDKTAQVVAEMDKGMASTPSSMLQKAEQDIKGLVKKAEKAL